MKANRRMMQLCGVVLYLLAGFLVYTSFRHFYWLAPERHMGERDWVEQQSTSRLWAELQRQLRRTGPDHKSHFYLGRWGDKTWVEWIVAKMQAGEEFTSCSEGHLDSALLDLTNQRPGGDAAAWLAWWSTNANKSQLEWIREGFAQQGIELQTPLTESNIISLLILLDSSTNSLTVTNIPHRAALKYNASRWLRDSGFNLHEFTPSNLSQEQAQIVQSGADKYTKWLEVFIDDPGELAIDQ